VRSGQDTSISATVKAARDTIDGPGCSSTQPGETAACAPARSPRSTNRTVRSAGESRSSAGSHQLHLLCRRRRQPARRVRTWPAPATGRRASPPPSSLQNASTPFSGSRSPGFGST
jgi:hypothetical protein